MGKRPTIETRSCTESATLYKQRCGTKESGWFRSPRGWNSVLERRSRIKTEVKSLQGTHIWNLAHGELPHNTSLPWRHTCFSFTVCRLHLHCMWHLDNRHTTVKTYTYTYTVTHQRYPGEQGIANKQVRTYRHTCTDQSDSLQLKKLSKLNVFVCMMNCYHHTWSKPNVTLVHGKKLVRLWQSTVYMRDADEEEFTFHLEQDIHTVCWSRSS